MKNLLLFLSFLLPFGGFAQLDTTAIDQFLQTHIDQRHFEGTVLVADQGKVAYQRTHGLADRKLQLPIQDDSQFAIASITKMLTAVVVLQLVDEDKLELNQSLQELLPEIDFPNGENITIHHLLLHISGLPTEPLSVYDANRSNEAVVRYNLEKGKVYGQYNKFYYNNMDYMILGLVIQAVTGKDWQTNIHERIITPLGLKNTGFLKLGERPTQLVNSYAVSRKGKFEKNESFHVENMYAAGNMYSNAHDLLIIDQAMYSDQLLSEAAKAKLQLSYPEYGYTGYSVWTYTYQFTESRPRIMERRGALGGFNVVLIRFLDRNQTLIILSNNDGFNPDSWGDEQNLREGLIMAIAR
ncbi:MAG: serine hydrolase domain-containing protein [Bacteroidota bacterium]